METCKKKRDSFFFSFVASVVNHQFLNSLVNPMVEHQLNSESTKGAHFAFKKRLIVPHCISVCIRLNFFFFLRNVKEMLLNMTDCQKRRGSKFYLFS